MAKKTTKDTKADVRIIELKELTLKKIDDSATKDYYTDEPEIVRKLSIEGTNKKKIVVQGFADELDGVDSKCAGYEVEITIKVSEKQTKIDAGWGNYAHDIDYDDDEAIE